MKTVRRCARGKKGGDTIQEDAYLPPVLANPGNLLDDIHARFDGKRVDWKDAEACFKTCGAWASLSAVQRRYYEKYPANANLTNDQMS